MVGELISFFHQVGQELSEAVNDGRAAYAVYAFREKPLGFVKGFFGQKQKENLVEVTEKAREKLAEVDPARISEPSPSILNPLVEAACQESRKELQDLWAAILANSTIDGGVKVRREYIDLLSQLEPVDAVVLQVVAEIPSPSRWLDGNEGRLNSDFLAEQRRAKHIDDDTWAVSCRTLGEVGCIEAGINLGAVAMHPRTTPLGRMLLAACSV
jgi:hypothetical protein